MDSPPYKNNPVLGTSKHISDDLFSRHWRGELTSGKKHEQKTHKKELGGLPTNRTALQAAGTGLHWGKLKRNSARSAGKKCVFCYPKTESLPHEREPAPRTGACPTNRIALQIWNLGKIVGKSVISGIGQDGKIEGLKTY